MAKKRKGPRCGLSARLTRCWALVNFSFMAILLWGPSQSWASPSTHKNIPAKERLMRETTTSSSSSSSFSAPLKPPTSMHAVYRVPRDEWELSSLIYRVDGKTFPACNIRVWSLKMHSWWVIKVFGDLLQEVVEAEAAAIDQSASVAHILGNHSRKFHYNQ